MNIENDTSLKISTHVGDFFFEKIGYIQSKEAYNAEIEKKGHGRKLYKSSYAYVFNKDISSPAGCYMIFEQNKKRPSYIGKTTDVRTRFRCHLCYKRFEEATINGRKLNIFFCPTSKKFSAGAIEALTIGYLWHRDLWNRFN